MPHPGCFDMQIYLNGEERQVPNDISMRELVDLLELGNQRLAIEVNEELVPRSTFEGFRIREQDRVEIIHAVGGG